MQEVLKKVSVSWHSNWFIVWNRINKNIIFWTVLRYYVKQLDIMTARGYLKRLLWEISNRLLCLVKCSLLRICRCPVEHDIFLKMTSEKFQGDRGDFLHLGRNLFTEANTPNAAYTRQRVTGEQKTFFFLQFSGIVQYTVLKGGYVAKYYPKKPLRIQF